MLARRRSLYSRSPPSICFTVAGSPRRQDEKRCPFPRSIPQFAYLCACRPISGTNNTVINGTTYSLAIIGDNEFRTCSSNECFHRSRRAFSTFDRWRTHLSIDRSLYRSTPGATSEQRRPIACRFPTSRRSVIFTSFSPSHVRSLSVPVMNEREREREGVEKGKEEMERDRGNGGKSKEHLCQLGRNRATDGWAKQVGRHAGILRPLVAPKALSLIHRSSPRRHDFFSLRTRTLLLRLALVSYFVFLEIIFLPISRFQILDRVSWREIILIVSLFPSSRLTKEFFLISWVKLNRVTETVSRIVGEANVSTYHACKVSEIKNTEGTV